MSYIRVKVGRFILARSGPSNIVRSPGGHLELTAAVTVYEHAEADARPLAYRTNVRPEARLPAEPKKTPSPRLLWWVLRAGPLRLWWWRRREWAVCATRRGVKMLRVPRGATGNVGGLLRRPWLRLQCAKCHVCGAAFGEPCDAGLHS